MPPIHIARSIVYPTQVLRRPLPAQCICHSSHNAQWIWSFPLSPLDTANLVVHSQIEFGAEDVSNDSSNECYAIQYTYSNILRYSVNGYGICYNSPMPRLGPFVRLDRNPNTCSMTFGRWGSWLQLQRCTHTQHKLLPQIRGWLDACQPEALRNVRNCVGMAESH